MSDGPVMPPCGGSAVQLTLLVIACCPADRLTLLKVDRREYSEVVTLTSREHASPQEEDV